MTKSMNEKYITYQQAITQDVCLICGKPAHRTSENIDRYGAPYCLEHQREFDKQWEKEKL